MPSLRASKHRQHFDRVNWEEISLLEDKDSAAFYDAVYGPRANKFDLPDDHWLGGGTSSLIGCWSDAAESRDCQSMADLLSRSFGWDRNDTVFFVCFRTLILKTRWKIFLEHWDSFVHFQDEFPLLIRNAQDRQALMIGPRGQFFQYQR